MMMSVVFKAGLCNHSYQACVSQLPVLQNFHLSIKTSAAVCQQVKMTRMLEKMVKKQGKRKWAGFPHAIIGDSMGRGQKKPKISEGHRRRAEQVGRVLYDYIISLVNSGELHPRLVDCAVDIVKVKVVPDFSSVNVFWAATGTDSDVDTQKLLDMNAGKLREMLIRLRPIGRVPKVQFVQDLSQARVNELERLLAIADMGPPEDNEDNMAEPTVTSSNQDGAATEGITYTAKMINAKFRKDLFINQDVAQFSPTVNVDQRELQNSCNANLIDGQEKQTYPPEYSNSSCKSMGTRIDETPSIDSLVFDGDKSDRKLLEKVNHGEPDASQIPDTVQFRHDLYDVNREELVKKVLNIKRRAKDRSFNPIPSEPISFQGPNPVLKLLTRRVMAVKKQTLNMKPYGVRDLLQEETEERQMSESDHEVKDGHRNDDDDEDTGYDTR